MYNDVNYIIIKHHILKHHIPELRINSSMVRIVPETPPPLAPAQSETHMTPLL